MVVGGLFRHPYQYFYIFGLAIRVEIYGCLLVRGDCLDVINIISNNVNRAELHCVYLRYDVKVVAKGIGVHLDYLHNYLNRI